MDPSAIRDAATIVLVRDADSTKPRVLMGQRGAQAAFMPNKFVFPGGAVDASDCTVALAQALSASAQHLLTLSPVTAAPPPPQALIAAAIRELWEEAGLALGVPAPWAGPLPPDWQTYAARGLRPDPAALSYIFRAVTPPGRTRRFDARFFLARAEAVVGDLDDFSAACDELSHLHWIDLAQARSLDLPFITEVVLAEAEAALRDGPAAEVPFFDNSGTVSTFRRLG
jgi:8-oxo-dGTP pyrophosphatase MutT (NUDIX family)